MPEHRTDSHAAFMPLPQTHLQLLRQMHDAGYGAAELAQAQAAYWLAAECFSGRVRASGKPFLCHLVGTAAAAVTERPPLAVIQAALCHGIHRSGDFGRMRPPARDALILARLGAETDAMLRAFAALQRDRGAVLAALLAQPPAQAQPVARWRALIWAANEVDELADAGLNFSQPKPQRRARVETAGLLCRHFGWHRLQALLEAAKQVEAGADWARPLASPYVGSQFLAHRAPPTLLDRLRRIYWRLR
ncbi:MAG: hypothetical protein Tsb0016_05180 [Sphingomonadales bacterium]